MRWWSAWNWRKMTDAARRVYRIQARDGRGPYRPGFSHIWCDADFEDGTKNFPTWGEEFGDDLISKHGQAHEYFGSAVRSIQKLCEWFSPRERGKLKLLGFNIVSLHPGRVLAESENQLVFARRRPLNRDVDILPWDVI